MFKRNRRTPMDSAKSIDRMRLARNAFGVLGLCLLGLVSCNCLGDFIYGETLIVSDRNAYISLTNTRFGPDGTMVRMGTFTGSGIDLDPAAAVDQFTSSGYRDGYFTVSNPDGSYRWTKTFGGASTYDLPQSAMVDNNNEIIVAANFQGSASFSGHPIVSAGNNDLLLAKLSETGSLVWLKVLGASGNDAIKSITVDPQTNDVVALGVFSGTVNFNPGGAPSSLSTSSSAIFVVRYSENGELRSALKLDAYAAELGSNALAIAANGDVYIAGAFAGSIDLDPGPALVRVTTPDSWTYRGFVVRLNSDGVYSSHYVLNATGSNNNSISGLALDFDGSIYISGTFSGSSDFDPSVNIDLHSADNGDAFVMRLTSELQYTWGVSYGSGCQYFSNGTSICYSDSALPPALDPLSGDVMVTGIVTGTTDFDPSTSVLSLGQANTTNYYMLRLSADGAYQQAVILNTAPSFSGYNANGHIFIGGTFSGSVDFNPFANENDIRTAYARLEAGWLTILRRLVYQCA